MSAASGFSSAPPPSSGQTAGHLLELRDLSIGRGLRVLQRALNLRLGSGEVVHLIGPNGCGKTTLLETIAGLNVPEDGEVIAPDVTESLWIGHRHGFAPELDGWRNLRLWCRLHEGAEEGIAEALDFWRIRRAARRAVGVLSAGQQQRLALATLRLKPAVRLWLLDEPLSALDSSGIPLLAQEIRRFRDAGGGVLMTSHQAVPGVESRVLELQA